MSVLDFIRARFLNWPRAEAVEAARARSRVEWETLMANVSRYSTKETLPPCTTHELEKVRRYLNRALGGSFAAILNEKTT